MDFDTDEVLEGDTNTKTFPPNLAALPTKRGKNPTGINGKRPSRKSSSHPTY